MNRKQTLQWLKIKRLERKTQITKHCVGHWLINAAYRIKIGLLRK